MDKAEILSQLRAAKAAHISWVQRAKMLIGGLTINESSIPVNSTECAFGKWFYSEAQRLNDIRNNPVECMNEIEDLHFKLHDTYLNIYKIYYQTGEKGFFSKLFGQKKKVSEAEQQRAKEYYDEMEAISKKLVAALNTMEKRINVLSSAELEAM